MSAAVVEFGAAVWKAVRPWARLKAARNKRRARLGKPLLPITEEDDRMFPKNTMTVTGGALGTLSPSILLVLQLLGVGECTPEALDMGCIGAAQIAAAFGTVIGVVLLVVGNLRARFRDKQ